MPTYDYECRECGHRWELFQQMKENPKRKCPECGRLRARRLIGPGAGIIFKGSGFYQTDYRGDSYANDKKKDTESGSSGSSDSSKSSDKKGGSAPSGGTSDAPSGSSKPSGSSRPSGSSKPKKD